MGNKAKGPPRAEEAARSDDIVGRFTDLQKKFMILSFFHQKTPFDINIPRLEADMGYKPGNKNAYSIYKLVKQNIERILNEDAGHDTPKKKMSNKSSTAKTRKRAANAPAADDEVLKRNKSNFVEPELAEDHLTKRPRKQRRTVNREKKTVAPVKLQNAHAPKSLTTPETQDQQEGTVTEQMSSVSKPDEPNANKIKAPEPETMPSPIPREAEPGSLDGADPAGSKENTPATPMPMPKEPEGVSDESEDVKEPSRMEHESIFGPYPEKKGEVSPFPKSNKKKSVESSNTLGKRRSLSMSQFWEEVEKEEEDPDA